MAARTSSTSDADAAFAALLARARDDEAVLGFWLGGSRSKGRATVHSDYDCGLVVADANVDAWRSRVASAPTGMIDAAVFTLADFAEYAAWEGPQAWDRYSFVGVRALIDRTGDIQALIDAKGRIPDDGVAAFVDASIDRFINQTYRALKCLRDGDDLASRLESAQAPDAFLDALFALAGGRLRPFPKYLAWELNERPLANSPWSAVELLALLDMALGPAPVASLQAMLRGLEPVARQAGHGKVFDAWGAAHAWMKTWSSSA